MLHFCLQFLSDSTTERWKFMKTLHQATKSKEPNETIIRCKSIEKTGDLWTLETYLGTLGVPKQVPKTMVDQMGDKGSSYKDIKPTNKKFYSTNLGVLKIFHV